MERATRFNNQLRSKSFQNDIQISLGELIYGESINKPHINQLIECSVSKGEHTISGYITPSIVNGGIKVQWFVTDIGNTSMNKARVLLQEYQRKYNKQDGRKIKTCLNKAYVLIYV